MEIDKQYFMELEETLQMYAEDGERYRTTVSVTNDRPPEAFVILALRCINFMEDRKQKPRVHLSSGSIRPRNDEVKIDFFPRATHVYFGSSTDLELNPRMKMYMLNLNTEEHLKNLDYTADYIYSGFCVHCNKQAKKKHPDYEKRSICNVCLKVRNRFLVVVE